MLFISFAVILVLLVYDHNQREERKRELMDSEVMLQRMQMKYKVLELFFPLAFIHLSLIKDGIVWWLQCIKAKAGLCHIFSFCFWGKCRLAAFNKTPIKC